MNLAFFTGIVVLMVVYFFANPAGAPELQPYVGYMLVVAGLPVMLLIAFILQGLRSTPAVPPTRTIRTWFGNPDLGGRPLGPGYHFYPFRGYWGGHIDVPVGEKDFSVEIDGKTPDGQSDQVIFDLTVVPDFETNRELYELIRSEGSIAGSVNQVRKMTHERGREWLQSRDEGPQTWEEAQGQQEELIAIMLKHLADDLEPVDLPRPTPVLMKYFGNKTPLPSEEKKWGKRWKDIDAWFRGLTPDEQANVRAKIDARRRVVNDMRQGRGKLKKRGLGLEIRRINCVSIAPLGKTEQIANRLAQEMLERRAESLELEHFSAEVKKLVGIHKVSYETAQEAVQIALKRINKEVTEHKFSIPTETGKRIGDIVEHLAAKLLAQNEGGSK